MKKAFLHQSDSERMASNSERNISAVDNTTRKIVENTEAVMGLHSSIKDKSVEIEGFTGVIKSLKKTKEAIENQPEKVVRKIEEVKSANLISNKLLKDIRDKKTEKIKVEIDGAELVTIKGEKGDKGDRGAKGEKGDKGDSVRGDKGEQGERGLTGERGERGERGDRGYSGKDGKDGKNGKDGKDGKDADEKNIIKKVLEKMPDLTDTMNQVGILGGMGGNGWKVTTPSGTIDGSNTTFTVERSPIYIVSDGIAYFEGAGYTYSGGTITMTSPPVSYIRSYQL